MMKIQSFKEQINYAKRRLSVTPSSMLASDTRRKVEWLPLMHIIADQSKENASLHRIHANVDI